MEELVILSKSMKFGEVSKNLMLDAGSSGGLTSLPPHRKPPTTPLKSPHPTPPTRKQRSPFLAETKALNLSSSASTQRATHSRPHHLPPTAAASRRRPAPPPTSTRWIRHGRLTCSVMKHCGLHSVFHVHPRRNWMCSKPCDQAKQHRHRISQANLLITPSQPDHAPEDHTHTPGDCALQGTSPRHSRPASPTRHNTHRKTDTPPQASHNPHS